MCIIDRTSGISESPLIQHSPPQLLELATWSLTDFQSNNSCTSFTVTCFGAMWTHPRFLAMRL